MTRERPKIVSVGSVNHDVTIWIPRPLNPDETLHATRVGHFPGGKGANQAVAAARLGADVAMVGCVGVDAWGVELKAGLEAFGVDAAHVSEVAEVTGSAYPIIADGEVSIIVHRGANAVTGPSHVEAARSRIVEADALLLQGEIGGAASLLAAQIARASGTTVIFNPAPVEQHIVAAVLPFTDVLIVNREEHKAVKPPKGMDVVITLGPKGADVNGTTMPGIAAEVVDPTGAGDAFAGALAVALAEGKSLQAAATFANATGSLAVRTAGAQPSMPTRAAVEEAVANETRYGWAGRVRRKRLTKSSPVGALRRRA